MEKEEEIQSKIRKIILLISRDRFAAVRLGHKILRTLMKRTSLWYLPGMEVPLHQKILDPAVVSY